MQEQRVLQTQTGYSADKNAVDQQEASVLSSGSMCLKGLGEVEYKCVGGGI